jgi:hypothetical protein
VRFAAITLCIASQREFIIIIIIIIIIIVIIMLFISLSAQSGTFGYTLIYKDIHSSQKQFILPQIGLLREEMVLLIYLQLFFRNFFWFGVYLSKQNNDNFWLWNLMFIIFNGFAIVGLNMK